MNTISIKNFRSIVDSGDIPVNRVNILLGKNSSGKSSFIRLFPMIKQTINHKMRGPLLWFDEYYDLGRFDTALRLCQGTDPDTLIETLENGGIAFGKGDAIIADLETIVTNTDKGPKTKHHIIKVHSYPQYRRITRNAAVQGELFGDKEK